MKKSKDGRIQVRPIAQHSMLDKIFKRVAKSKKRVALCKVNPHIVLADLRKGSLSSLSRYLAQEGGISDKAVAFELLNLISGSALHSNYSILVVDHPDGPKNLGGRPSKPVEHSLDQYRRTVALYEVVLPLERGKKYRAREVVAAKFECSDLTVKRAIIVIREEQLKVVKAKAEQQAASKILRNRQAALCALRKKAKVY